MIVSFHPIFVADKNITCAGREPYSDDLEAIKQAKAVVLPQGCGQSLYAMARNNCEHVFPNYDARFKYPGKIGQIQLFRETNTAHPNAEIYSTVSSFEQAWRNEPKKIPFALPFVFKFNWGGEGDTVYLIQSIRTLKDILQKAEKFEKSGQKGFLLQEYIPINGKTIRVVIIGQTIKSYWRVQQNTDRFMSSVSKGAIIDCESDPNLQKTAVGFVENFCNKTAINLAGFDVVFSSQAKSTRPLLLEINYFFGRKGLGGSDVYYEILNKEIHSWLSKTLSEQDQSRLNRQGRGERKEINPSPVDRFSVGLKNSVT